ncbi:hypothetical protein FB451DRAFT_1400345 [Mycena latifolia]|nr:hypothetical protein FB451DRAFT_1400345 [Mycena latifolia]
MLRLLTACGPCLGPSNADADDSTVYGGHVIPNDTVRLLPAPDALPSYSVGPPESSAVDAQKLNEPLGTIVRIKEGCVRSALPPSSLLLHHLTRRGQRAPSAPLFHSPSPAPTPYPPTPGHESAPAPRTSCRPPPVLLPGGHALELAPKAGHRLYVWRKGEAGIHNERERMVRRVRVRVAGGSGGVGGAAAGARATGSASDARRGGASTISSLLMLPVSPTLTYIFLFPSFCLQAKTPAGAGPD